MTILKIGIVADNYKIPSFRAKLLKEGLQITYEGAFTNDTTLITVKCEPEKVKVIAKICTELEIKLNEQKAKNN